MILHIVIWMGILRMFIRTCCNLHRNCGWCMENVSVWGYFSLLACTVDLQTLEALPNLSIISATPPTFRYECIMAPLQWRLRRMSKESYHLPRHLLTYAELQFWCRHAMYCLLPGETCGQLNWIQVAIRSLHDRFDGTTRMLPTPAGRMSALVARG